MIDTRTLAIAVIIAATCIAIYLGFQFEPPSPHGSVTTTTAVPLWYEPE